MDSCSAGVHALESGGTAGHGSTDVGPTRGPFGILPSHLNPIKQTCMLSLIDKLDIDNSKHCTVLRRDGCIRVRIDRENTKTYSSAVDELN